MGLEEGDAPWQSASGLWSDPNRGIQEAYINLGVMWVSEYKEAEMWSLQKGGKEARSSWGFVSRDWVCQQCYSSYL